jgi:N-acetylglucosaminyldiphosphoundecaprenol N-acetyl-beta-D-mannosaminyltransferase
LVTEGVVEVDTSVPALPARYDLFGVDVSAVSYGQAMACVIDAARARRPFTVTHLAVHGVIEGALDPALAAKLNAFDIVAPDGQPVRHALNWLYGTTLTENCRGPEFMTRVCKRAVSEGIGIYLYGSTKEVVEALRDNLIARYPGLNIVAAEPSVFRPLTEAEDADLIRRINDSGAGVVFVGLGCPRQEHFGGDHIGKLNAVQICVGAAFDFHAGNKKMAPAWVSRHSLEWLYRLFHEPRRLFKRYFITNSLFVLKLILRLLGITKPRHAGRNL